MKMGGARFGKVPGVPPRELTPDELENGLINALRVMLRRLARHLGVPPEETNAKVTRILRRMREEVGSEFRS